jgi:hypothetical protein
VVTLKIKLGRAREGGGALRYPLLTRRRTLGLATDDGRVLGEAALGLWDLADVREPVRLLGLAVSGLEPRRFEQLELFPARADHLGPTLDAIERRFGAGAIHRAVSVREKLVPSDRKKRGERP